MARYLARIKHERAERRRKIMIAAVTFLAVFTAGMVLTHRKSASVQVILDCVSSSECPYFDSFR
ncbi:hypothetical protein LK12_22680 [Novosphingobium malaysiense]|uniref:Uncharacterized protein n=1 Tax=Novosphingobium malaysiense TaxID=1348853 RepID=A0A0B1ZIJ5_9SPHN|nr:hypothetical protein LK12_22680 [Novosphingobium malaysiense]